MGRFSHTVEPQQTRQPTWSEVATDIRMEAACIHPCVGTQHDLLSLYYDICPDIFLAPVLFLMGPQPLSINMEQNILQKTSIKKENCFAKFDLSSKRHF